MGRLRLRIGMTQFQTERLILRKPESSDWPYACEFFCQPRAKFVILEQSESAAWRAFATICGHWYLKEYGPFIVSLIDSPNKPIGSVGPWFPLGWPQIELGWTLWSTEYEGQGYATEAASFCLDFIRESLRENSPVSYINRENKASIKVAKRLGAQLDNRSAKPSQLKDEPILAYRH